MRCSRSRSRRLAASICMYTVDECYIVDVQYISIFIINNSLVFIGIEQNTLYIYIWIHIDMYIDICNIYIYRDIHVYRCMHLHIVDVRIFTYYICLSRSMDIICVHVFMSACSMYVYVCI
jgi:hypothetical protein